ncbi:MAG TPA: hypothetical protein VFA37_00250 [Gaiellaceae bacterium]|nr:hypothetical protein [Gaiellaceae bacterium]
MPTRKQRRRAQKERRHEYETVWVDEEGNELEEPPEEALAPAREKRSDDRSRAQSKSQSRGGRAGRTPPMPSWSRAAKRSVILGVVIFAVFMLLNSKSGSSGTDRLVTSLVVAVIYTALFIPFTFYVDRWTYRRWEKAQAARKR